MRYQLCIFDFDGTLADSAGWFARELNHIARRFGFRQVSDGEIAMLRHYDTRAIIRYLQVPWWKLPRIARHMRRRMAADAASIPLFAGTGALLEQLQRSGVTIAIVSSNSEANVRMILGAPNASRVAHFQCGASLLGKAGHFRRLLRQAAVPAQRAIGIGDEARDIEAATKAGIAAAAVTWGYASRDLLARWRPDMIFDAMEQIPPALAAADRG